MRTLAEIRDLSMQARAHGRPGPVLALDNDSVTCYEQKAGLYEKIFDMHPEDLLREALTLLGVSWKKRVAGRGKRKWS